MSPTESPDLSYATKVIEENTFEEKEKDVNREKMQKHKYNLLNKLVKDLFRYKDSPECYNTISNLIITSLTLLEENHPVDLFFGDNDGKSQDSDYEKLLKAEFKTAVEDMKKRLQVEANFREVIARFTRQYDSVKNVEFCPKIKGGRSNN
ncbi:MAG: hypothetical protein EU544_05930 [Promethearchaeota archaeon]|nr:MAG: hypothetical protein EU544_05930 [Candidatus Lokiarchaeota archaeon]